MKYRYLGMVAAAAVTCGAFQVQAQNADVVTMHDADTAQDSGTTTTREDILGAPRTLTVPEDKVIILDHSITKNFYFQYAFKSITLGDDTIVKAVPLSDHVIALTGLAPGKSFITLEKTDGQKDRVAVVTAIGSPHVVRMYTGSGARRKDNNELTKDNPKAAGYHTIYCTTISCGNTADEARRR